MPDDHPVIKKPGDDQRRRHPSILRLTLGSMVNRQIGSSHFTGNHVFRLGHSTGRPRTNLVTWNVVGKIAGQQSAGHATRHLTGVIAAHTVGENCDAQPGVGKNGVLIV